MSILQKINTAEFQAFLAKNRFENPHRLLLKKMDGIDMKLIVQQITGRQKAKIKLPLWFNNKQVIYPKTISIQQCSSQQTAIYKANLVQGNTIADLTGGFGVDSYFLAKNCQKLAYVEQSKELFEITQHNFNALNQTNVSCYNTTTQAFLTQLPYPIDGFYIDPARRVQHDKKVFTLLESEPNIVELEPLLLEKANWVLVKASPMLDIQLAVKQLQYVQKIYVVAVENECKELLFYLSKTTENPITIECVNLLKSNEIQQFNHSLEDIKTVNYSLPKQYLYDPNKAILKAGLFNSIAQQFNLQKLHPNTHLYTTDVLISDFPGRIFELETTLKPQKKNIQKRLVNQQANLATRNFPSTVAQLRKKWNIKDGGSTYLFAVTLMDNKKVVLKTRKIN